MEQVSFSVLFFFFKSKLPALVLSTQKPGTKTSVVFLSTPVIVAESWSNFSLQSSYFAELFLMCGEPGTSGRYLRCLQLTKQKVRHRLQLLTRSLVSGSSVSLVFLTSAGIKSFPELASYHFRQHRSVMTEGEA